MVRILLITLVLAFAGPAGAQDTEAPPVEAQEMASSDEYPEPECNPLDERFDEALIDQLSENPVSDASEFDCEADWIRIEEILQWTLPIIGEPSFGDYDEPADVHKTLGIRYISLAYGSVQKVQSVLCSYGEPINWRENIGIGGVAREAQFFGWGSDQERGVWEVELSASDCEFFQQVMENNDPDDIVHAKLRGSSLLPSGEIILVSGRSFYEFLESSSRYSVKLRPGLSVRAGEESERAERAHDLMLDYFTHRARREGTKAEIPDTMSEDVEE